MVSGEERADWWQLAVDTWDTYAEYQKKTDREIPVFVLERATDLRSGAFAFRADPR